MVAVGRITDPFPFLWALRPALVIGGLAGFAWVLAPGSLRDKVPVEVPQVRDVFILMVLAIITIPLSVWPGGSVEQIIGGLWKLVLFFLLVFYWCRSIQDVRRLIWACCFGVTSLVLYGIFTGSIGYARFSAGSNIYDPNDLAMMLAILLPLSVYLFLSSRLALRLVSVGMVILCIYGIILTKSRGGFLALVVVGILLLWRSPVRPPIKLGLIMVTLVVFGTLADSGFWDRIETIWDPKDESDRTAGSRTGLWTTALSLIATRPWGSGFGMVTVAEGLAHGGAAGSWNTTHNSFLQVGVELGVAGFVVFVHLVARTLKDLRRLQLRASVRHPQDEVIDLASMLEISLWGFIVGSLFLSQAYSLLLYLVLGLSLACTRITRPVGALSERISAPGLKGLRKETGVLGSQGPRSGYSTPPL